MELASYSAAARCSCSSSRVVGSCLRWMVRPKGQLQGAGSGDGWRERWDSREGQHCYAEHGGRAGAREGRLAGWLTGRLPGWPAAWQMILCERATSRQYAASSRLAHMTK